MAVSFQRRDAILLLGLVAFAWGTTWPVTKAILDHMPPLWTTAVRSAIAALALFGISVGRRRLVLPQSADMPIVFSIALLHMVAFSGLIAIGLQFVPAGRSVVLGYTTPFWVTIGARLFISERVTRWQATGVFLGMCGLVLLFNPVSFDWADINSVVGNFLVLLAALCWAASIVHIRAHRWISTPFELVPWEVLIATCVLVALAFSFEGAPSVSWNLNLIFLLTYGGLMGIAVPYWAMITVARNVSAVTTSVGLLGVPVIGLLSSALALNEPITFAVATAMAMIITGILIGMRR